MAEIELTGRVLPARACEPAPRDDLLRVLTMAWLDSQPSGHTKAAYERDLKSWLGWCEGIGVHPLRIAKPDVDNWISAQRDHGVRPGGPPAAKSSIARRVSVVASWYDYLIESTASDDEPVIRYNPAHTKARPKVDKDHSPTVGLSRSESDRLIAAADADSPRSSAIIRLMLTNAVRASVIAEAEIGSLGHDRGHRTLTMIYKGDKKVRDPLPPPTAEAIDAYLASRGSPASGLLFCTRTGRPVDEPHLRKLVRRLARNAGIPSADNLSPHSLRHTAITEALDATGDLRKAQDLAHHADPRTTRLYDLRRGELDGHAAYVLATRYGTRREQ
jgi:integrase/recombinase XerD